MVSTRRTRRQTPPAKRSAAPNEPETTQTQIPPSPSSSSEDEEPPKPVSSSSSSSSSDGDESLSHSPNSTMMGVSRLFSPYRTLGVVTSGAPFHLQSHANTTNMVALPIGERFHIVNTDRLQPILVSQAVPQGTISHIISDASLSVSIVGHAHRKLTLFYRTRPLQTLNLETTRRSQWSIQHILPLGKTKVPMKAEKEGTMENALLVAIILAKHNHHHHDDIDVPIVGDDDDDDDDNDSTANSSDAESDDNDDIPSCQGQVVLVLATRSSMHIQRRIPLSTVPTFHPTSALHPSTYLNKILLGGTESALLLLNVRSAKVIHNFTCLPSSSKATVTALEQSPAVDTIAVGMSDGMVHLINLRHDQKLFSLKHKPNIKITSLSFRTDGSAMRYGIAPLAVGRDDGTISIWDLTPPENSALGRTLLCQIDKLHPGGVAKLTYLPQEPMLLSTGTHSNAVCMHVFDNPDHSGRLLRQRKGHVAPPKHIRYLHPGAGSILVNAADGTDASSCQILSSGGTDRTLRIFSTVRSVLDKEYSQGQGLEKRAKQLGLDSTSELLLPPLTAMVTAESRSRDWGDLVTIHRNHAFAYVWSTKRGAQSGPILRQLKWNISAMQVPPPKSVHATSIAISACGNFALVGTAGGTIYKYNVQSGLPRGSYPKSATIEDDRKGRTRQAGDIGRTMKVLEKKMLVSNRPSDRDKEERDAVHEAVIEQRRHAKLALASHTGGAVTGLAVDSVNKTLISVGTDAKLILWNFSSHAPHKKSPYKLPSPATKLCHVRDSDLAAIAMEDFSIVLFDCATLSIVRRFGVGNETICHTGPISDLGFSPDGRNLFTSSLDGTLRVWDVPTNTCVDWLSFHTAPTSLTVSPTGEFLATTHVDKVGISLWSDRSFYQTVHMDGAHPPMEPAQMDDPAPIAETSDGNEEDMHLSRHLLAMQDNFGEGVTNKEEIEASTLPPTPKDEGLITLSGLPPAHWKNLFHLELVKERNKPKEPPKKPPSAPFFLQWRSGEAMSSEAPNNDTTKGITNDASNGDDEEWNAAWSDDDGDDDGKKVPEGSAIAEKKRDLEQERSIVPTSGSSIIASQPKKRKVTHHRSHMAALLEECFDRQGESSESRFQKVTDHVAMLGPSAIDIALSTLCNGMHDLEDGLPLLHMASLWLLEACERRERYEAVNAYLHRFLYLHTNVLAGIRDSVSTNADETAEWTDEELVQQERELATRQELLETIGLLRKAQQSASDGLRGKMQHTLCLLRHFSRMV